MFDHEIRAQLGRERVAQLKLDWPAASPPSRIRLTLGRWLIRAGDRLTAEACRPSRELSFRA